ncbi:uncharacterized protein Bfra_003964 [Botrytis fragariae]|uniref:Uncharacterized protein n=1 Tax=Botrytis fragariae TaxID=1964551 RepID=A0A8H6AXZ0_9HELO|nr:uncharacterized protein Bfra_003964 [Botrytis fragariae]KAF5875510.1 hypothetical protein Bfra_003964 [Botrytis fragariae]
MNSILFVETMYPKTALRFSTIKSQAYLLRITMKDFGFNKDYLVYMDSVLKGIVPYCISGDGKFKYPVNKKRTKQNTEQMILAEKNLDCFWHSVGRVI